MDYANVLKHAKAQQQSMLETLETLVIHESPSYQKNKLRDLASVLKTRFSQIGASVQWLDTDNGRPQLRISVTGPQSDTNLKPALILGHFDTVWPVGTLKKRPFRVEQNLAFGPGGFDMKGGLVIIEYALQFIHALQLPRTREIVVFLNSDEEIGSPYSRDMIMDEAVRSEYVLVLEPALPGGVLKTARKGVGAFTVSIQGRAAHAGSEPEKGISAVEELAHQILHVQSFADPEQETTINPGRVSGGTRSNVVPARAEMRIDCRVWTNEEACRVESAFRHLKPFNPDITLKVRGGFGRPPMERLPGTGDLFDKVRQIGTKLGLTLTEGKTGGASDGNFCASLGISTLDGLGVEGSGAHAEHENVIIESLPERAALLASILSTI
ncbi:MAG: M20 family metallopeptidase [Anaerolineae bacterium]|nr:M20 family metallopeptidase [Anaerolineae bacterium]